MSLQAKLHAETAGIIPFASLDCHLTYLCVVIDINSRYIALIAESLLVLGAPLHLPVVQYRQQHQSKRKYGLGAGTVLSLMRPPHLSSVHSLYNRTRRVRLVGYCGYTSRFLAPLFPPYVLRRRHQQYNKKQL